MEQSQYEILIEKINQVNDNQIILERKIRDVQNDMITAINNQKIIGKDLDKILSDLKDIKVKISTKPFQI